ncbi:MAG TPA: hypothetical protein VFE63_22220 [Roseiarcus sp.]|nr:hypothetical protein [Roseiarcus sp.]
MLMPVDVALWLQKNLSLLCEEDLSLAYFSSGNIESIPDRTVKRWQLSVDALYRTITCDLIAVYKYLNCNDRDSFFEAIRTCGPEDRNDILLWNGTLIYGTEKLEALARSFFDPLSQGRDDLNPAFVEALEQIFAENGVPWSNEPLLPIVAAGAAAAEAR